MVLYCTQMDFLRTVTKVTIAFSVEDVPIQAPSIFSMHENNKITMMMVRYYRVVSQEKHCRLTSETVQNHVLCPNHLPQTLYYNDTEHIKHNNTLNAKINLFSNL